MAGAVRGRGAESNTPNRFEELHREPFGESDRIDVPDAGEAGDRPMGTSFYRDSSKSILARNDSPDIPFTYSINPYRGCEHGCVYCYARPSHEYLGFSAGLDFETKILVKEDAPALLAAAFRKKSWKPQWICFSGNTDCYQPAERSLQLTRRCLEVCLEFGNPAGIITKNRLVTRDIDVLRGMARRSLIMVSISITSLDPALIRTMEPRTSTPATRLDGIEELASHGIPVSVHVAPVIPGLNDEEIPAILREASARGARAASWHMVRLPGAVQEIFSRWIEREMPARAPKVLRRIREMHGGTLNDAQWNRRMSGEGVYAAALARLFETNRKKYGLNPERTILSTAHFRRPESQLSFDFSA